MRVGFLEESLFIFAIIAMAVLGLGCCGFMRVSPKVFLFMIPSYVDRGCLQKHVLESHEQNYTAQILWRIVEVSTARCFTASVFQDTA